jgi:hypothetical protein
MALHRTLWHSRLCPASQKKLDQILPLLYILYEQKLTKLLKLRHSQIQQVDKS